MTVFIIPSGNIHTLETLFQKFQWAQGVDPNGKCRLVWGEVCKPIPCGGLGFKRLAIWNRALVSKHLYDILARRKSLWVEWLWNSRFNGSLWDVRPSS